MITLVHKNLRIDVISSDYWYRGTITWLNPVTVREIAFGLGLCVAVAIVSSIFISVFWWLVEFREDQPIKELKFPFNYLKVFFMSYVLLILLDDTHKFRTPGWVSSRVKLLTRMYLWSTAITFKTSSTWSWRSRCTSSTFKVFSISLCHCGSSF